MGCRQSHSNTGHIQETTTIIQIKTTPAFSSNSGGTIRVESNAPIRCTWKHNNQPVILQSDDDDRKCVKNVPPGSYQLICSYNQFLEEFEVQVDELEFPKISHYEVKHATSDRSRDGRITATVSNIDVNETLFLWSCGVTTTEPTLHDVHPGKYTLSLISKTTNHNIPFYHACVPAIVEASESLYQ
jgi:hypothetical protein